MKWEIRAKGELNNKSKCILERQGKMVRSKSLGREESVRGMDVSGS